MFLVIETAKDVVLERLFNKLCFDHTISQTGMLVNKVELEIIVAARENSLGAKICAKVVRNTFGDDFAVKSFLFVGKSSDAEVSEILIFKELLARIVFGLEVLQLQVQLTLNVLSLILGIVVSRGSRHAIGLIVSDVPNVVQVLIHLILQIAPEQVEREIFFYETLVCLIKSIISRLNLTNSALRHLIVLSEKQRTA